MKPANVHVASAKTLTYVMIFFLFASRHLESKQDLFDSGNFSQILFDLCRCKVVSYQYKQFCIKLPDLRKSLPDLMERHHHKSCIKGTPRNIRDSFHRIFRCFSLQMVFDYKSVLTQRLRSFFPCKNRNFISRLDQNMRQISSDHACAKQQHFAFFYIIHGNQWIISCAFFRIIALIVPVIWR